MQHLEVQGQVIIARHKLKLMSISDVKRVAKYIEAGHSTHQVTFGRNGREKWGPEYRGDYLDYRFDHKEQLFADYPLDRLYWLVAFRHWWGNGFQDADRNLWLSRYLTILGNPYEDFPAELNWKTLLYQLWIEQSKKWRNDWKKLFVKEHPEAASLDVFTPQMSAGRAWEGWRLYSFIYGLEKTEQLWHGEALLDTEHVLSLV